MSIGGAQSPPPPPPTSPPPRRLRPHEAASVELLSGVPDDAVRVGTWNLRFFTDTTPPERVFRIADVIVGLGCHVILLQEMTGANGAAIALKRLLKAMNEIALQSGNRSPRPLPLLKKSPEVMARRHSTKTARPRGGGGGMTTEEFYAYTKFDEDDAVDAFSDSGSDDDDEGVVRLWMGVADGTQYAVVWRTDVQNLIRVRAVLSGINVARMRPLYVSGADYMASAQRAEDSLCLPSISTAPPSPVSAESVAAVSPTSSASSTSASEGARIPETILNLLGYEGHADSELAGTVPFLAHEKVQHLQFPPMWVVLDTRNDRCVRRPLLVFNVRLAYTAKDDTLRIANLEASMRNLVHLRPPKACRAAVLVMGDFNVDRTSSLRSVFTETTLALPPAHFHTNPTEAWRAAVSLDSPTNLYPVVPNARHYDNVLYLPTQWKTRPRACVSRLPFMHLAPASIGAIPPRMPPQDAKRSVTTRTSDHRPVYVDLWTHSKDTHATRDAKRLWPMEPVDPP